MGHVGGVAVAAARWRFAAPRALAVGAVALLYSFKYIALAVTFDTVKAYTFPAVVFNDVALVVAAVVNVPIEGDNNAASVVDADIVPK